MTTRTATAVIVKATMLTHDTLQLGNPRVHIVLIRR